MQLSLETGTANQVLRTVSKPVRAVTSEHRSFVADMIRTMEEENGVGLAAPQVGRNERLIVCKFNPGEANEIIVPMVNPQIIKTSDKKTLGEEGCLSLPGVWGKVERSEQILVRFKNLKNQDQTLELSALNARIVQHEIDHLDGVLFVDRAEDVQEGKKNKSKEAIHI